MKRFSLVLCLVLAVSLVLVGSAFANFGPHGGYATDTDSCAGCHRAHTSFSTVAFEALDPGPSDPATGNALLVGGATTMREFCYACHGDAAPGASTNVEMGVFDSGPSMQSGAATSGTTPYATSSHFNKPLNGGGFTEAARDWDWNMADTAQMERTTSAHNNEQTSIIWGAGNGSNKETMLTCVSCHDPHGSSNYRLLKDNVNGLTVGGYTEAGPGDFEANPYVSSIETGYPTTGWAKGEAGAAQMRAYRPDYTGGTKIAIAESNTKSLSTWCSACHENYNDKSDEKATDPGTGSSGAVKDYGTYEGSELATVGAKARHRHPMNITLLQGDLILQVQAQKYADEIGLDPRLPLEADPELASVRQYTVGCLTCHLAHGSSQTMTGWAAASLIGTPTGTPSSWVPTMTGVPGVDPDTFEYASAAGNGPAGTSTLLRADNRGVCERCHNK